MPYILALDQGTTSSRAIVFDHDGAIRRGRAEGVHADLSAARLGRARPAGDLGHADRASRSRRSAARRLRPRDIAAIGITNQRETTIVWDRETGRADPQRHRLAGPPHRGVLRPAQGRRARGARSANDRAGDRRLFLRHEARAGSSTTCPARAQRAERGELAFGTVDSLARLEADRRRHARHRRQQRVAHDAVQHPHAGAGTTSCCELLRRAASDAARGALLERGLRRRRDRASALPTCRSPASPAISRRRSSARRASTPGMAKNTYGTGCFLLMNTGTTASRRRSNSLLTTVAWKIGDRTEYALEGSVFIAGAVVQWLRDGLGLIRTSAEVEALAASRARQRRRVSRAGVRRARRAALGSVRARHDRRAHARHDRRRTSRAPRSRASPTRSTICSRRCGATPASRSSELRVDGGACDATTC